jgi:hypothetical protein
MPIERMDHFTVLTKDAIATAEFHGSLLGFELGPRPAFSFPGVWLYSAGKPILHVVEKDEIPAGTGVLDHMAFWGTGLAGYAAPCAALSVKGRQPKPSTGADSHSCRDSGLDQPATWRPRALQLRGVSASRPGSRRRDRRARVHCHLARRHRPHAAF